MHAISLNLLLQIITGIYIRQEGLCKFVIWLHFLHQKGSEPLLLIASLRAFSARCFASCARTLALSYSPASSSKRAELSRCFASDNKLGARFSALASVAALIDCLALLISCTGGAIAQAEKNATEITSRTWKIFRKCNRFRGMKSVNIGYISSTVVGRKFTKSTRKTKGN